MEGRSLSGLRYSRVLAEQATDLYIASYITSAGYACLMRTVDQTQGRLTTGQLLKSDPSTSSIPSLTGGAPRSLHTSFQVPDSEGKMLSCG